jgi:hypothetical protein
MPARRGGPSPRRMRKIMRRSSQTLVLSRRTEIQWMPGSTEAMITFRRDSDWLSRRRESEAFKNVRPEK